MCMAGGTDANAFSRLMQRQRSHSNVHNFYLEKLPGESFRWHWFLTCGASETRFQAQLNPAQKEPEFSKGAVDPQVRLVSDHTYKNRSGDDLPNIFFCPRSTFVTCTSIMPLCWHFSTLTAGPDSNDFLVNLIEYLVTGGHMAQNCRTPSQACKGTKIAVPSRLILIQAKAQHLGGQKYSPHPCLSSAMWLHQRQRPEIVLAQILAGMLTTSQQKTPLSAFFMITCHSLHSCLESHEYLNPNPSYSDFNFMANRAPIGKHHLTRNVVRQEKNSFYNASSFPVAVAALNFVTELPYPFVLF